MNTALRSLLGLAAASLSGLLLTLAFPPFDLWPLAFVGFVPAAVAQHRLMPRRLSGLAYGVGLGGFYWGYFGPMFAGQVWFMQWLPLFVLLIATFASQGDRAFHERTGYKWFVLEGAVVWVGIEAIRGLAPFIGTGGLVAFSLYSQPWLIQPVSIFGIFGLGLLIMSANYAIALGILSAIDSRWPQMDEGGRTKDDRRPLELTNPLSRPIDSRLAARWSSGVAVALLLWFGLSVVLLNPAADPASSVKIAAIQPGPAQSQAERTSTLLAQTRLVAAQGARLVVWPEGSLDFDPQVWQTPEFRAVARETGVYLAIGYGVNTAQGLRNEMTLIGPDGQFLGVYGKDHPVAWMGETSTTRGTYPTFQTPFGTIGMMICYDLNFTDTARKMAANGAQIIVVGSNDWSSLAQKQYTNLAMRAVENRVALVKADSMYDSAMINPTGYIVASAVSTSPFSRTLVAGLSAGKADAPLILLGDWLGWLSIAGTVIFALFGVIVSNKARRLRAQGVGSKLSGSPVPEGNPDQRSSVPLS